MRTLLKQRDETPSSKPQRERNRLTHAHAQLRLARSLARTHDTKRKRRRNRNRSPGFGGAATRANSLPQPPIYKCSYICIYMAQASCFPRHASVMVERGRGEPHHTPMQGGASPARYVWRLQRTAHVARKCMCMYTARPHAGQSQCMCIRTLPPLHLS